MIEHVDETRHLSHLLALVCGPHSDRLVAALTPWSGGDGAVRRTPRS